MASYYYHARKFKSSQWMMQYLTVFCTVAMLSIILNIVLIGDSLSRPSGEAIRPAKQYSRRQQLDDIGDHFSWDAHGRRATKRTAQVFKPVELGPKDWLMWVRIQKTGSLTLLKVLQKVRGRGSCL